MLNFDYRIGLFLGTSFVIKRANKEEERNSQFPFYLPRGVSNGVSGGEFLDIIIKRKKKLGID